MKRRNPNLTIYRSREPQAAPYPNAADDRYFARKALDILTALVSGAGFISAMVFLLVIC